MVSCDQLRHTMATQMLNADADLMTAQDLLGRPSSEQPGATAECPIRKYDGIITRRSMRFSNAAD